MFRVSDLQAVEPESLTNVDGVAVAVVTERDSMGFPRVDVYGESLELVIEYVRANWGDEDADWFRDYVIDRVAEMEV